MSYVLFHIKSGEYIKEYATEAGARTALRVSNRNAGCNLRITRSFFNGYEAEWCRTHDNSYDHGPYGITEWHRWSTKFDPKNKTNRVIPD
jgi:hypothetical protein